MDIAIKSEADSRVLVYPLIKALYNHGTVAIYTSNKFMMRLIENEYEGGFKNVRVVVNPDGDLDAIKESDEYYDGKYDFLILDNVGAVGYDMLIAIITNRLSESYMQDLLFLAGDDKTHILKFGKPAPKSKDVSKSKPKSKSKGGQETDEELEANKDFNKWHTEKTDEDLLHDMLDNRTSKWCNFPSYESIELMESRHYLVVPDDTTLKEIYRLLGDKLNTDERQFLKGAKIKDESGSDISGADVW